MFDAIVKEILWRGKIFETFKGGFRAKKLKIAVALSHLSD